MDDEISAEELRALLDSGAGVRIVDIRSPAAFERGHIPGSENVPFAELTSRIESFDGDDHVVTVCPHGKASVQAARLISSYEGFDGRVESLAPGIQGWARDNELEVGSGQAAADGGERSEGTRTPGDEQSESTGSGRSEGTRTSVDERKESTGSARPDDEGPEAPF